MKKTLAILTSLVMVFAASAAMAKTVEPEDTDLEHLAGKTVHATVGAYNEDSKVFTVTVYENDRFEDEEIAGLAAGDILLAGGRLYTVREMTKSPDGDVMAVMEDGSEIVFSKAGDDEMTARSTDDDRQYMHAVSVVYLPAAEGIVFEDNSNPDLEQEMTVTEGLEGILKIKAEKEENSNGLDFYATTVTLNGNLEIVKIHQDFDVAQ